MLLFNFKKNSFFNIVVTILLIIYFIFGIILSINAGISHDEFHEQNNWEYNLDLIKFFFNSNYEVDLNFRDRFYGVGFQFLSQPIQYLIKDFISYFFYIDGYGSKLISKHPVIFTFYFLSGYFFYKIILLVTNNKSFSLIGTFSYLLYPYLFGHSFVNPKDIPFLSIWMILTYYSFYISNIFISSNDLKYVNLFFFGIITAYLISIRISGLIILVQYLITFILLIDYKKVNLEFFLKEILLKLIFFVFIIFSFIIIFYPIFWFNPSELINSIKFMSNFPQDVCTLTLGKCIKALDMDPIYIPVWFLVKLPVIIIIGIFLLPICEKKIFNYKKNKIFFGSLILSSIIIPLILILNKTPLYDEVRHIIFLTPIFYILGLVSIFFIFKKKANYIIIFLSFFFIFENYKIYPYQYTWFNLPARVMDIGNNFEIEYLGISGREISKNILKYNKDNKCLVVSPVYAVKPYLKDRDFSCFIRWQLIESKLERPFYAIPLGRNIKKGLPFKCKEIYAERINLPFYKKKIIASKLIKCD